MDSNTLDLTLQFKNRHITVKKFQQNASNNNIKISTPDKTVTGLINILNDCLKQRK